MTYFVHKRFVKAESWAVLGFVTLQCLGRAIEARRLYPRLALILAFQWAFIPAFLLWLLRLERPHPDPIAPEAPPWAATRDDYTKLTLILLAMIMIEFVFKY